MKIYSTLILVMLLSLVSLARAGELKWSGQTWIVRDNDAPGGPGPNLFSGENVSVDADGRLHLRISKNAKGGSCAELSTKTPLGFGTYEFAVKSSVAGFDPNIVLGLYNYPEPKVGPDGTHELDIEFARWGDAKNPPGNFTVWPVKPHDKLISHPFDFKLALPETVNRMIWSKGSVKFEMLQAGDKDLKPIEKWTTPPSRAASVSDQPMPVHLNLWLFKGNPPTDGKPLEVIIERFTFTPQKAETR